MIHFEKTTNTNKVVEFAICENDEFLAYPDKQYIKMFNLKSGRLMKRLSGHFDPPMCCVFRGGSDVELYSAGADHAVVLWTSKQEEEEFLHASKESREAEERLGGTGLSDSDLWSTSSEDDAW
mmetsp:Transcript_17525/g.31458  ORF Transcript_17525/g.31458 Transcript_17525/m.31458 type:complete len:123 (+) Transcript_17525:1-369(+)